MGHHKSRKRRHRSSSSSEDDRRELWKRLRRLEAERHRSPPYSPSSGRVLRGADEPSTSSGHELRAVNEHPHDDVGRRLRGTATPGSAALDAAGEIGCHSNQSVQSEPKHLSDREANLDAAQPVFQEHDDVALDPHVLEMLGETGPSAAAPYQFHSTLSASWKRICCQGLDPAKKSTLLKDVVIPSNDEFLIPPKLNPIVRTILSGPNQTRDDSRCAAQAQLGQGLSFLGKSINEIITNHNTSVSQVLPLLTQAGQVLTDLMFCLSKNRRELIAGRQKGPKTPSYTQQRKRHHH
ncbi:hypothetical protein Zmor_023891 [Zophobas morio]|uniref:Uncharacterized protein n=1 Tax=Zophobas morio TaxID=2755281 RepID=A0AA38M7R5_9CUCU|nr:hypothetical protein Zmor_023891 [Zophobas morio]